MINEIWKPVVGFEGLYEVSSYGRVRTVPHYTMRGKSEHAEVKERVLKFFLSKKGYYCIKLRKDGIAIHKRVHRLVAEAFIPNPENKPQIDHIDTDKLNNVVSNLRWATPSENKNNDLTRAHHSHVQSQADVIEKCMSGRAANGGKTRRRAVRQYDKNENLVAEYSSMANAQRATGIKTSFISSACSGKIHFAGGYRWEYAD